MPASEPFEQLFRQGNALAGQGRHAEAVEWFRRALAARPNSPAAHNNLGNALADMGRLDEAIACYRRALELSPDYAEAYSDLGLALHGKGLPDEAVACYHEALRLRPDLAQAMNNLGAIRLEQGDVAEAKKLFGQALHLAPHDGTTHYNLGLALHAEGNLAEAAAALKQAVGLSPSLGQAWQTLASVLAEGGRREEAVHLYRGLLTRHPEPAPLRVNLAALLLEMGRLAEAEECCRAAVAQDARLAEAHLQLGIVLQQQGQWNQAVAAYDRAVELGAGPLASFRAATALPIICRSREEAAEARQRVGRRLAELERQGLRVDPATQPVGTLFYLAYHGEDDREIMESAARVCGAGTVGRPPTRHVRRQRVRLGLVSAHFGDHTIGHQWRGNVARLSRERFEVTLYSLDHWSDQVAASLARSADRFVALPRDLAAARRRLASEGEDVLLYPAVGMHPGAYALACVRLVPVQCAFWGHPVTTGLPTIDYFISTALAEDESAQAHYTERLARLASLGLWLEPPATFDRGAARRALGLPEDRRLYGCLQSLFKIHPDDDALAAEILRRDPEGELVLLEGNVAAWNALLRERLARSMPDALERVRFLPRVSPEGFLRLSAAVDVLLDPLHFGGGRTTYEGLAQGTPVVTLPSPYLRGRLSLAVYRQMEVLDCVAGSREEYVELALRLAEHGDFRDAVQEKILAGRGRLFEDRRAVEELEKFLLEVAS